MLAAFCTAPGRFELRDVVLPAPRPGELLLRVRSCGVCGSDLHWFNGLLPPPAVCPGHEISAEVVDCNSEGSDLEVGDLVVVEPLRVCGSCAACRTGDYQICPAVQILGVTCDGGFAEYVAMPRDRIYPLPSGFDFAVGGLTEPMAVSLHGARIGNIRLGDRVLVIGAGTIGLLSVLAARNAGAQEVAILARHEHQAAMARRLGATQVFLASSDGASDYADFFDEHPCDVVMETVGGRADTLDEAVRAVRGGGTIVVLGLFSSQLSLNGLLLVAKEMRIVGSFTYGRHNRRADFETALRLVTTNHALEDLVTHRFGLDRIQSAFAIASDKKQHAIKVSVLP